MRLGSRKQCAHMMRTTRRTIGVPVRNCVLIGLSVCTRIGGLGHLAIAYAAKAGYTVVAISRGPSKKDSSLKLGVSAANTKPCVFTSLR